MELNQLIEIIKKPSQTVNGIRQDTVGLLNEVYQVVYPKTTWYAHFCYEISVIFKLVHTIMYKRPIILDGMVYSSSGKWTTGTESAVKRTLTSEERPDTLSVDVICVTKYIKGIITNIKKEIPNAVEDTAIGTLIKRKLEIDATVFVNGSSYLVILDMVDRPFSYTDSNNLKETVFLYVFFKYLMSQEEPVPELLYDFIHAMLHGDIDGYNEIFTKILEPLRPAKRVVAGAEAKSALYPLFEQSNTREIKRISAEIENIRSRITSHLTNISDLTRDLATKQATLTGFEFANGEGSNEKALELEDYLKCNKAVKSYELTKTNGAPSINLEISTPVRYYDEALLKKFISRDAYPALTKVFNLMLNNPKYKLLCKTTITIIPSESRFFIPSTPHNNIVLDDNGLINPHLVGYNCFGGNTHAISKAFSENDMISVVTQCVAAVSNINFSDATVIRFLQGRVQMVGADNLKFYDVKSKEIKTYKEITSPTPEPTTVTRTTDDGDRLIV